MDQVKLFKLCLVQHCISLLNTATVQTSSSKVSHSSKSGCQKKNKKRQLAFVWPLSSRFLAFVWPLSSLFLAFFWPLSSLFLAFVWLLSSLFLAFVWPLSSLFLAFVLLCLVSRNLTMNVTQGPLTSLDTEPGVPKHVIIASNMVFPSLVKVCLKR